ncbi:hypothetical protein D9613_002617 [Agrocybe pediades]|uniref:Uncharacterized protein n=1 Tax=Agrocybe pediades TaxID=84607 RepID=A0A8H4VPC7_9AGAR|nr:hypothetical protein D9613_002617 [Agrocybe pediades]
MKTFALVILSVILSATATPLGDRTVARRHNGIPLSRRYILQSRTDAPPACVAPVPSGTATTPDVSATGLPVPDTTTADNSTDTTGVTGSANSTVVDPSIASNTTLSAADNSTATTNTTATRRFWARHGGFGFGGFSSSFSDVVSESTSVSVSFEETVSSFVETWEDLCLVSGGDIYTHDPCTNFGGYYAIDALSEYADSCDQQVLADSMITFAKSSGIVNRDALINYAISFRRHPRHAVEILGVVPSSLYCLTPPINEELVGVYNDQLEGVNPGLYGSPSAPIVPFGSEGTCPLGMTADVSSCGCVGSDGTTDVSDGTDTDTSDSTDDSGEDTPDDSSDDSTDDSSDATATDSADASTATDATSTDSTDAALDTDTAAASAASTASSAIVTPPPSSPTDINVQPTDISGNVNDPAGRR